MSLYEKLTAPGPHRLWRCRSCQTLNDFDGVETAVNTEAHASGELGPDEFRMLSTYACHGCDFELAVEPMWFVVPQGEMPVFIETGYSLVMATIEE